MINKFLQAKHWQIFILTYGITFLIQIAFMIFVIFNIAINQNPSPTEIFNYFQLFPFIIALSMIGMFGWQWSIGVGLQKFLPEGIQLKITQFKTFLIIPAVYVFILCGVISFSINKTIVSSFLPNPELIAIVFAIIIPIHLFCMFCTIHTFYFLAKTIKTVEFQREVSFSDYIGEFFLLWFFIIGIWILQPKINKIQNGTIHDYGF